jgi:O-antigen ligase
VLHPAVRARFATAFSASANPDRIFIWSRALEIIRDHPLHGVGFANYPLILGPYYDRVDPHFFMRTWAHNLELSTLAEMGPLGLVALFWLLIAAIRMLLRSASPFVPGALATLAAWFTIAQAHDVLYDTKVMYALWFSLALATSPGPPPATSAR